MNAPLKPQTRFLLENTGGVGYFFDAPSSYWEARNVDEVSLELEKEKKLIEYTDRFIKEQNTNLENLKIISDYESQKQNIYLLKSD